MGSARSFVIHAFMFLGSARNETMSVENVQSDDPHTGWRCMCDRMCKCCSNIMRQCINWQPSHRMAPSVAILCNCRQNQRSKKTGFMQQNPAFWILTTLTRFCAQPDTTAIVLLKNTSPWLGRRYRNGRKWQPSHRGRDVCVKNVRVLHKYHVRSYKKTTLTQGPDVPSSKCVTVAEISARKQRGLSNKTPFFEFWRQSHNFARFREFPR